MWYKRAAKRAENVLRAVPMSRERTKQTFKLQLLAFVLAIALLWSSLDPAPRPLVRITREEEPPEEKKREAEPQLQRATIWPRV
jgi:uncharacterized protein YydD (DUF2326 family)